MYRDLNYLQHFGILGMKWGVRRYENKDGTLTDAGKKRYNKEQYINNNRKKDNKKDDEYVKDVNRWVKEDDERAKRVADASGELIRKSQEVERETRPPKERMNLSHMTDKEMREKINRELLERQYNDIFNPPKVSKGRKAVKEILTIAGGVAGGVSSALAIAISIRDLKGKKE